jgi:hypothetical protein
MVVHILVTPRDRFTLWHVNHLAEYVSEVSGPSYIFIKFFPEKDLLNIFMQGETILSNLSTHELEHHADRKFGEIFGPIQERAQNLQKSGRMSSNSWIALLAVHDLRSEGMPHFSEDADKGIFTFYFEELEEFVKEFKTIADLKPEVAEDLYPPLRTLSYRAGYTMVATILATLMLQKEVRAFIGHVERREWEPAMMLNHYYGLRNVYLGCPNKDRPKTRRIARALLVSLEGKSILHFLNEYDAACQYLRIRPIIGKWLYNEVKKKCHYNFLIAAHKQGISGDDL